MSDDLFSYFSNKGTRKVDPIDDDDFNSFGANPQPEPDDSATSDAPQRDVAYEDQPNYETPAQKTYEPQLADESPQPAQKSVPSETTSRKEEPKKEQGHWDFLASVLGIKRTAEEKKSEATAAPEPAQKNKFESRDTRRSESSNLFELERQEVDDESPILSTLFQPSSSPEPIGEEGTMDDDDLSDPDLDYLEFEVEELDQTVRDDDGQPRRSRREGRTSSDSGTTRDTRRPTRDRSKDVARRPSSESFDISDDASDEPITGDGRDSNAAERGPRRRRRRRTRRSESKGEPEATVSHPSPETDDRFDPPDEFFDETGWQPSVSDKSTEFGGASTGAFRENDRGRDDEKPRRRRRRPGGQRSSNDVRDDVADTPRSSAGSRTDSFDDAPFDEDDDDFGSAASSYERDRGRGEAEFDGGDRKSKNGDDRDRKHSFPTWDEAIAGLVESNIKNHAKYSSNSGRPRSRGRRRR